MESLSTNILVVEDNADDSFMLVRQLEKAQIDDQVTVVDNGSKALEWLQATTPPPLAVFLDLKLPGMSGMELLENIRGDSRLKDLPVIIMTGSSDPNDLRKCEQFGVSGFLEKPVSLTNFIKTVAHLFPKASAKS